MADGGWPLRRDVLLSLSEDVKPKGDRRRRPGDDDDTAVAVRACLDERVVPIASAAPLHNKWPPPPPLDDRAAVVVAAAERTQTRLMAVPSAYVADGTYYAAGATHVSRTVEELCHRWPDAADTGHPMFLVYVAGVVRHDGGACHLHGLTDPRCRVPVDCGRLTVVVPRHRSAVKMYGRLADGPVLVPHHFHVFAAAALYPPRAVDRPAVGARR